MTSRPTGQDPTEHVLDQVREALNDVAGSASEAAGNVYSRGEHYVRQAGEHYPQAQRYVREGQSLVTRYTTGNPLLSLFMAGAIGYALAWMIHGERRNREPTCAGLWSNRSWVCPHHSQERR